MHSNQIVSSRPDAKGKQETRTWFPVISPFMISSCYFVLGLVFVAIGLALFFISRDMTEVEVEYTNDCQMLPLNTTGAPYCFVSQKKIRIPKTMTRPVYLYYKLENVYQNFRKYVTNLNDQQLSGGISTSLSSCYPFDTYNGSLYNPCGTIPYSMFNDTFNLYNYSNQQIICNGVNPTSSSCSKDNIAWSIDRTKRFKLPPNPQDWVMNGRSYEGEEGHVIPRINDEDLMVWMRLAALPVFRKLYRVINVDLPAGDYYFEIEQRWPVRADLGMRKKLVLANGTWFGGRNMFLAIAYLSVGGLSLLLTFVFLIACIVQKCRERRILAEIKRTKQNLARRSARQVNMLLM